MQRINRLYSDQSEDIESSRSSTKFNQNRALLLILDRSFDYCAPLAHDYSYWSLFFDLLQGRAEHALKESPLAAKSFTEDDDLWQVYKTLNMAEAQLDLRDKIQYYQNQVQPGKGKNLTDEQLLQAFRKQPDEEQKQAFMIIHSQTLSQLTKVIQ
jgi:hypothetical protein